MWADHRRLPFTTGTDKHATFSLTKAAKAPDSNEQSFVPRKDGL
jgi:hypothetical protein